MRKQYKIKSFHGIFQLTWNSFVFTVIRTYKLHLLLLLVVDRHGISFPVKQQELRWNWPWSRPLGCRWFDYDIAQNFKTLEERRDWWQVYYNSLGNTG